MTKDEALDLALEALESTETKDHRIQYGIERKAIAAIKQARSAPAQEPVAFNAGVPPLYPEMKDGETISVEYTTPPAAQRQWVSLTDEQIKRAKPVCADFVSFRAGVRYAEARYKERQP